MNILILEDTKEISDNIKKLLEVYDNDFFVYQAFNLKQANTFLCKKTFDLILLDLMLPDGDGFDFCKKIREKSNIPIIIMTAKWDDDDKILWLELWADDYIVKPFKVKELYLRIKSLIKRVYLSDKVKIGNIEIDFENKKVYKDWKEVKLKLKEFQILEYLYDVKTASRTDIIEEIWGDDGIFTADNKLDVNISNLRRKLDKKIIETIKWYGYRINLN